MTNYIYIILTIRLSLEDGVNQLLQKNYMLIETDAALNNMLEITHMKSKNPIMYKINNNGLQIFGIIKSNLSTFINKMLRSLKIMLVRPSFEKQFNQQFKKIVKKLSNDANLASKSIIENVQTKEDQSRNESIISLNTSEISLLEKEIRELGRMDSKIIGESQMVLPEHVTQLETELGHFSIPRNSEIVHAKFKNLQVKPCMELENGTLYEGQWSTDDIRYPVIANSNRVQFINLFMGYKIFAPILIIQNRSRKSTFPGWNLLRRILGRRKA